MDKQLFLLNSSLNNAILRTCDECVLVWELQLLGIQSGKVYSLQELQSSYKAAVKVLLTLPLYFPLYYLLHVAMHCQLHSCFQSKLWQPTLQYWEFVSLLTRWKAFQTSYSSMRAKDLLCMLSVSSHTLAAGIPTILNIH